MSKRRVMPRLKSLVFPVLLAPVAAHPPEAGLDLTVERVRNERGMLHICLTQDSQYFPDCSDDVRAIRRSVPASTKSVFFGGLSPGSYAVSVLHDENGNGRMDSFLGVPKEGFGFSGNPAIGFGPPGFEETAITLGSGGSRHTVRMRYVL